MYRIDYMVQIFCLCQMRGIPIEHVRGQTRQGEYDSKRVSLTVTVCFGNMFTFLGQNVHVG